MLASYIFYRRFPNNYASPNFFGEDGSIFTANYLDKGFWGALGQTFNGYYIWGIYMLVGIGNAFNTVFHHGQFINLPISYAVISYLFWGFCAALPLILLRSYLKLPYLILLAALLCFVPASGWDYQIIGTFGNFKFIFVYIAFLLILYRLRLPKNSIKVIPVDIALLVCGYTNITIYPMLLLLLLPYRHEIKLLWKNPVALLKNNLGLVSLVLLAVALVPQLIVIKIDGIPKVPGYLYGPFDHQRAIEVLIHRPYLYAVAYGFTKHMTDLLAATGFVLFLTAAYLLRSRKTAVVMLFGIGTIFMTTAVFVINRPGVSQFFFGYKAGGPAQFFFTQNMIFYVLIVILLATLVDKIRSRWLGVVIVLIFAVFIFGQVRAGSSFGNNDFMQRNVGTIYANARAACGAHTDSHDVSITIYPTTAQVYKNVPRSTVCTRHVDNYQASEIDLGLTPVKAEYLALGSAVKQPFTQTFLSPQPRLNGIDLYVSTFAANIKSKYVFRLYDASCKKLIRQVTLTNDRLEDNQYTDIAFKPIADSANRTYCFGVSPASSPVTTPIAIWLSPTGYNKGSTIIGEKQVTTDIVFRPRYDSHVN